MPKKAGWMCLAVMLVAAGCRVRVPIKGRRNGLPPQFSRAAGYRIDTAASQLRVLAYRSGPMARFGHNHVMVNRSLAGTARWTGAGSVSSFSLVVPAARFVVDEAQSRHDEGADFPGEISDDAKGATLRNMLGTALLDAATFPRDYRGTEVPGAQGRLLATVVIHIAGHESTLEVPFTLQIQPGRLCAAGSLDLRQTALGLTPFSLMMGALPIRKACG